MSLTALLAESNTPPNHEPAELNTPVIAFQALLAKPPKALNTLDTTLLTVLNILLKNPDTTLHIDETTPQALEAKLPIALNAVETTDLTTLNIPLNQADRPCHALRTNL